MTNNVEVLFERFQETLEKPQIELNYDSPYTLLIAVLLSAQCTDKMVNKVTPDLFAVAKTPQQICNLGEERLKLIIKSINYFNTKARNIIKTSEILVAKYNSQVPSALVELVSLPGIGRKSANVILNTVFDHKTIGVDTHVFRVSNRLGLCNTKTPYDTEQALMKIIPEKFLDNAHHWLVLHGRYICKARKPLCSDCKVSDLCSFYNTKHYV
jgi:endonuclease-3